MTEKIQIILNSKRADKYINGLTSECYFNLPNIEIKRNKKCLISVQSAVIPYSFYNVSSVNNSLVYTVNGETYSITISEGNYNVNTLKTELLSKMTNFSITYTNSKNKYTFTHNTYDFTFEDSSTCFEILGFPENSTYSSTDKSLTSTISINLFTIRNIYITSNNFILQNLNNYTPNQTNILCSIPVSSLGNSVINYSNIYNTFSNIDNMRNMTQLHIKLTDQDGDIMYLNGVHWSLTLELIII